MTELRDSEMDDTNYDGIIRELGEMNPKAFVSEKALARIFHREPVSIKRAVQRKELPPPVKMLGMPVWTAGSIIEFVEKRLAHACSEAEKDDGRIARLHR